MIKWLERRNKISWLITLLIAAAISYISTITFPSSPYSGFGIKAILYHIIAFFLFTIFLMASLSKGKSRILLIIAFFISLFYGVIDELHQSFVPGRDASLYDFMLNSIGIIYAFFIYMISLAYRKNK